MRSVRLLTVVKILEALPHAAQACAGQCLLPFLHWNGKPVTRLLVNRPNGCVSHGEPDTFIHSVKIFAEFPPCAGRFAILVPAPWKFSSKEGERLCFAIGWWEEWSNDYWGFRNKLGVCISFSFSHKWNNKGRRVVHKYACQKPWPLSHSNKTSSPGACCEDWTR